MLFVEHKFSYNSFDYEAAYCTPNTTEHEFTYPRYVIREN